MRSTSSAAQQNVPVTFGQVFKAGDVANGAVLSATLDGQPTPLQVDVKARHADGSLRHAVLSASLPTLAANATRTLALSTGGTAPGGGAVSISSVLATTFDAVVSLNIGGTAYTASARNLLSSGPTEAWLTGPLVSEWAVAGPVRRADGTAHPHLAARFQIRAYAGAQRIRVSVTVENNWALVPNPQRYTYNAVVTVDGKGTVLTRNSLVHYRQARWRRVFWWGSEALADTQLDGRYLMATGAVPNYEAGLSVPNTALDSMVTDFAGADDLMEIGNLNPYMPDGGGRPEIAPFPRFAARYVISEDLRAKRVTLGHGEQAGSWPMHYRDEQTGLPVSLDNHPTATITGGSSAFGSFPACGGNCDSPYTPEVSHHPSLAYIPYLVTGDYFFLEEIQFWASWVLMYGPADRHANAQGLIVWDQTRGQAWGLRALGHAAYATPDSHPLKSYYVSKLGNNLAYYNANWLNSNPLGYVTLTGPMSWLGLQRWISTWMDDFLTWSFGHLTEMGFSEARSMRDWKAKFPTGRMTDPATCWILASSYWPTVMDNFYLGGSGQPVRTWADWHSIVIRSWDNDAFPPDAKGNLPGQLNALLAASCNSQEMSSILGLPQNWMMGYGGQAVSYPGYLQPALAIAVDAGLPNAALGWATFFNADSYADYNADPEWAIVPRPTSGSAPTLTLSASPTSVLSGGTSLLTWSSSNATSCNASGDWAGNKGMSGTQQTSALSRDSTFVLDCSNASGSVSRSVTVTVTSTPPPPPPAPTLTLAANPASIAFNQTSTLTWSSTNATSCTASGAWSGARATSGSEPTPALTTTSTFTLSCTGTGGSTSRNVVVTVGTAPPPQPTVTLSANPTSVAPGASAALTWASTNATSCTASGGWSGSKGTAGNENTGPLNTTLTFTLSCTGAGGSASASAQVTVASGGGGGGGSGSSGGGGALGYPAVVALLLLMIGRRRSTRSEQHFGRFGMA